MPRKVDIDTDMDIKRLAKELRSIARLDWRDPDGFQFAEMPTLASLLQLEPGKKSVDRLRERLLQLTREAKEEEDRTPPRHNRSLAAAWLALLALGEGVYDSNVTERRQWLITQWLTKRGHKIKSVDSFKRNQEPDIYGELATRLVASELGAPELPKPRSQSKPNLKPKSTGPKSSSPRPAPWPVREHQPTDEQEIVILIAAQAMRSGPASGLVKLVREFEPYWRATEAMIYSLEGSYKEIWRAGLLHDYDHFAALPAGFYGGLVHATELVIAAAEADPELRAHVVYLIDPHDTTSLYPASASLKRECLLTRTAFLTSYRGAARWFRLEWARRAADGKEPAAKDLLVSPPKAGFPEGSELEDGDGALALAAHDRHKRAMMDFADRHVGLIDRRFPKRWATQVTGHVLNGGSIHDDEYQEDVLTDVGDQRREQVKDTIDAKSSEWQQDERSEGPGAPDWIPLLTRGRQGGVIQLARKVLNDECDTVLFFQDAETPREHDTEIQVLDRAAQLADSNCLLLHDERSADRWAENLEICLGKSGASTATTLVEAFRRVFDVELVLAHPDGGQARGRSRSRQRTDDSEALWARVTAMAAIHIVGALKTVAETRAERDEPVRFGFPWGGAIRDILGRVEQQDEGRAFDRRALAGALGLHDFVEEHSAADLHGSRSYAVSKGNWLPLPGQAKPFGPGELRVVPTVGVIGARDRSLESHSLVDRAVRILGGKAVLYPESAFALADGRGDPWGGAPKLDWSALDVLLLSAAPLQERSKKGPATLATALPADLATHYSGCEGAVGTIYLEEHDGEVRQRKHAAYRQVGMSMEEIRKLKAGRAEVVLVNGAQGGAPRRRAAWAALKAGLATTFITDEAFAWGVLKEEMAGLKPPGQGR